MLNKLFFLYLLSFVFLNDLTAQPEEDYQLLLKKCCKFSKSSLDSLLHYSKQLQKLDNQYLSLYGKSCEAKYYYFNQDYATCEKLLLQILDDVQTNAKSQEIPDIDLLELKTYSQAKAHLKIIVYRRFFYMRKNQHKWVEAYQALDSLNSFIEVFKENEYYYNINKIKLTRNKALVKRALGFDRESLTLLLSLKQYINRVEQFVNHTSRLHYLNEVSYILSEIAKGYQELSLDNVTLTDSAESYHEKAFEIAILRDSSTASVRNHKKHLYIKKSNIARIRNNLEKALGYIRIAETFKEDPEQIDEIQLIKSICYSELSVPDSAIHFASIYLGRNTYIESKTQAYNILAMNYFKTNRLDSAYKYSMLAKKEFKENTSRIRKAYLIEHEVEQHEIFALNEAIINEKNERKTQFFIIISLTSISAGIASFFVLKTRKKNKVQYQKLVQKYVALSYTRQEEPKPIPIRKQQKLAIDDQLLHDLVDGLDKVIKAELFLDKNFNLANLAKMLNTNTAYLSKIINEKEGKSFKQYIMELRINALIKALDEKPVMQKHSVEALANYAGYANSSSFSRAFKTVVNKSPSEYIKTRYPQA